MCLMQPFWIHYCLFEMESLKLKKILIEKQQAKWVQFCSMSEMLLNSLNHQEILKQIHQQNLLNPPKQLNGIEYAVFVYRTRCCVICWFQLLLLYCISCFTKVVSRYERELETSEKRGCWSHILRYLYNQTKPTWMQLNSRFCSQVYFILMQCPLLTLCTEVLDVLNNMCLLI